MLKALFEPSVAERPSGKIAEVQGSSQIVSPMDHGWQTETSPYNAILLILEILFTRLFFFLFLSLFLSLFLHLSLTASSALHGVWVYTRAVQIPIVSIIHGLVLIMSSLLSRLNPAPAFPAYTGPYKVGTQELEIPISDLPTSSPPPDANITTVSFRIFYPCEPTKPKFVYWLPSPQGDYFRAYARFLSAGPGLASFLR